MKKTTVFLLCLSIIACPLFADTIYKKDGTTVEGKILSVYEDGQVQIESGNKTFYVKKDDIERIKYSENEAKSEETNWWMIGTIIGFSVLAVVLGIFGRNI